MKVLIGLFFIFLVFTLPLASALQISDVRAEGITDKSATIKWETDEPTDSFVHYGVDKEALVTVGDANPVTSHQFQLTPLTPSTTYQYKVESNSVTDDNLGDLYSFTTLEPDTVAPPLIVTAPARVQGNTVDLTGTTEANSKVRLLLNNNAAGSTTTSTGNFTFTAVLLQKDQENVLLVEAEDPAGNVASFSGTIVSDTKKPVIQLEKLPELVEKNSVEVKGTISEPAKFQILVGNSSAAQGEGQNFSQSISLEEGLNTVVVMATDLAGWENSVETTVASDTQPPTVTAKVERGTEYYEGRAESTIHGSTEAGATAFLYVYRPLGYEFQPDFKKARAKTTANEQGEFTFDDVDFAVSILDQPLENLAPREVPSGLKQYTIFPIQEVTQQQQFTYYVFIIVEDKTGKSSSWQTTVNVHTCFSQNLDFSIESLPKFQAPLRLVPQLMDDGRQEIQAVFQLNYLGSAVPKRAGEAVVEPAVKVTSIQFEPACTTGMAKDDKFSLGCKIFPSQHQNQAKSNDGTTAYVAWKLRPTKELSQRDDDFWNDFKKRQLLFPLKIKVFYQEREGENKYGPGKFQTSCYDLGYFVDIPIDSKELLPDFLADEGVEFLDESVKKLTTAREFLEKGFFIAGLGCMGSFLGKTAGRWIRVWTTNVERYTSWLKIPEKDRKEEQGCKSPSDYYLQEEIEHWQKLFNDGVTNIPETVTPVLNDPAKLKAITLEERCPKTASAWKFEALMDQAYKWSCDRAFCRAVPAAWTAEKETDKISAAILKQQQCAVTGRGVPLIRRENCKELIKANPVHLPAAVASVQVSVCWQTVDGVLYMFDEGKQGLAAAKKGIFELTPVGTLLGDIKVPSVPLKVYRPEGAQDFIVGRKESCKDVCDDSRKPGFIADAGGTNGASGSNGLGDEKGCYTERTEGETVNLYGQDGTTLLGKSEGNQRYRYTAGYTDDCFVVPGARAEPVIKQCVCVQKEGKLQEYKGVREANKKEEKDGKVTEEEWFYHQERVFLESGKTKGTYYPDLRYYSARDQSSAFGQNHLLDIILPTEEKKIPEINPHSQFVGAVQTVCLSSILKNVRMLESIMTGMRNCLVEAKKTGLQDAGMCKTLFTQHVCGLFYKLIAYLASGCNPDNFDDYRKEGMFGDAGVIVSEGLGALPKAMESSVKDLKEDYGNAQLNQFFKAGAQGFAQSICLAAFGIEFPLFSKEFLLDAAYSVPMKTSVVLAPKERELSTYNPAKQTAVFNYNLGGLILPGCRIRNWRVSLKCIGPEDLDYPGIDPSCNGQKCDCLNAPSANSPLEGEKTKLLKSEFNLKSGEMFSIPLEAPLPLDSHYRYDHVLVELFLDPSEKGNEDKCFDEGYFVNGRGVFYEPLIDTSPPVEFACRADLLTGRYVCPELASVLGFGGAQFEEPYVQCWSRKLSSWVDCTSPNLFVKNDEIKLRLHLNLDEQGKCLKRTVQPPVPGIPAEAPVRQLPANVPGPLTLEENLGTVNEAMFGGGINTLAIKPGSNPGCGLSYPGSAFGGTGSGEFQFQFVVSLPATTGTVTGMVELVIPSNAVIETTGYTVTTDRKLAKSTTPQITTHPVADINSVIFNLGGFRINNVLGTIDPASPGPSQFCTYHLLAGAQAVQSVNMRNLQVTYELLERDEGGGCALAKMPVQSPKPRHTQQVKIQQQEIELIGLHENFKNGNYESVQVAATNIINQKQGDLNNALAIYYWVASLVMKGQGVEPYKTEITNLLKLFFSRNWAGEQVPPYSSELKQSAEYTKICVYLGEIAGKANYNVPPAEKCSS